MTAYVNLFNGEYLLLKQLNTSIPDHDYVSISPSAIPTDGSTPQVYVFKVGGASGTTVATITILYDTSSNVISVAKIDGASTSAPVNNPATGSVVINGTATQGQTLTTSHTLGDLDGIGAITYQWKRNSSPISGATGTSYTLVQADVGFTITVTASFTDALNNAESVTSAATSAVADINDAPTGSVTISGTPQEGQVLTAANTLADADGIGVISYQWKRAGVAISGATSTTYTLVTADVGNAITVTASYTDTQGTAESVTSSATATITSSVTYEIQYTINNTGTTFELRDYGTVNYVVDWGDGSATETVTTNNKSHTYASAGTYIVKLDTTGSYKPYYNSNVNGDQVTAIVIDDTAVVPGDIQSAFRSHNNMTSFSCSTGLSNVTNFSRTWYDCNALTSFPLITLSTSPVYLFAAWSGCSGLTSFPLLNTSTVINVQFAWRSLSSLTSFPALDLSNCTSFSNTWYSCSGLTSFPLIDTSSGTTFDSTWNACQSLTSFPSLNFSSGTNFKWTWRGCYSLTTFPANRFDSTGTLTSTAFDRSWQYCALTAQSIENILTSLDTNGASNITLGIDNGTNAAYSTWSTAAQTALTNLTNKGWTVTYNT